jgi:predicted transglutaminase-like cysteine proteinase
MRLAALSHYDYFSRPAANDAWSVKIGGWQLRERADGGDVVSGLRPVSEPGASFESVDRDASEVTDGTHERLRSKYVRFRAERKRSIARQFAEWIQSQAPEHYQPDGPVDHWATLESTLQRDGDDCDGLELLTYHGLRDLGFGDDEVFRAIVYRPSDSQHHMVTLWFENPEDPWVIDPTGAMTLGMPRMSELPAWVPLKIFSESEEYTVRPSEMPTSPAGALVAN